MNAVHRALFVAHDTARNVPTGSVGVVLAPSQKGSTHRVFDQQVDAEEGSEPAQQTEYGFWQSLLR
jgi:hypothetical protein